MLRIEIPVELGENVDGLWIHQMVRLFVDHGYEGTEGTLKKYPGSMHWHLRKPKERGTLELTWWPEKRQCWISVHANRRAAWQEETIEQLKKVLSVPLPEEFKCGSD